MAARQQQDETPEVTPEIHNWLSENGKKGGKIGGQKVKELIQAGKMVLGEDVDEEEEVDDEDQPRQ